MSVSDIHENPSLQRLESPVLQTESRQRPHPEEAVEGLVQAVLAPSDFLSARLLVQQESQETELELELDQLRPEALLAALQHTDINLETTQSFISGVSDLLGHLRRDYGIPEYSQTALRIDTVRGPLWIDPQQLDPSLLLQSLSQARHAMDPQTLQQTHQQLAPLAEAALSEIRQGGLSAVPLSADLEALRVLLDTPDFPLPWLHSLLNAELASAPSRVRSSSPPVANAGEGVGATEPQSPAAGLSAAAEALIALADQLEASLELVPKPNSPDVLELFRAFAQIFRQLDQDLNQLIHQQSALKKFERRLQDAFNQQLQEAQRFTQEKLSKLRGQAHERLRQGLELLLEQSLHKSAALLQLCETSAAESEPIPALRQMQTRLRTWLAIPH